MGQAKSQPHTGNPEPVGRRLDNVVASVRPGGGVDRAPIRAERTLLETPFVGVDRALSDDVDPRLPPFGEFGIGALEMRSDDGHEL